MNINFPFTRQRDAMDCGPSCLAMVAAAYGRIYPLPYLREHSFITKEGVSALGIMEAAELIGFRSMTVKVPFDVGKDFACLLQAPLPCIAHWNQRHFVVIYKANKHHVWLADPASGKYKVKRKDFEQSWLSYDGKGILILLEPTPEFYRHDTGTPSSKARWRHLLGYIRPYYRLLFQVVAGMAMISIFSLILPFLTQSIVDFGIDNRNIGFIYLILFAQLALFISQMTVQLLQSRILLFVGARMNVSMVSDFLVKLMQLPIGFFDTKMTGDLMQRITDQDRVEAFLTHSALPVLFSAVNFIVFGFILATYNLLVFTIFTVSALLYVCWILFFLRRRKEIDYVRFQQSGENNNNLLEIIQGMQEIKLQGSERKRRWIWAGVQAKLFYTSLQSLSISQWQDVGAGFINQSKNIFITFIAAHAVIDGEMTLGMMLAVQYMVGQMDAPLHQFIDFIRAAQDAKISLERMGEIQDQPNETALHYGLNGPTVANMGDTMDTIGNSKITEGDICIENLSFRYSPISEYVLQDINLVVPRGKVTAIVGSSGSGKTTLVKLLLGFYPITKGGIYVGRVPLQQIAPEKWRKRCGTVMQDGFLFSDTIANNLTESDEHPNPHKLLHAVEIANIREFIEDLPLRYNTKIGATGNGISQGQRQRLLIARAVYKSPDYLFFDEATNALDANNERTIVENLAAFYSGSGTLGGTAKTVVVIAHRLSTVRHADQIVVLEKGKIVETGTHDELTSMRGAYFNLVKNQLELGA